MRIPKDFSGSVAELNELLTLKMNEIDQKGFEFSIKGLNHIEGIKRAINLLKAVHPQHYSEYDFQVFKEVRNLTYKLINDLEEHVHVKDEVRF